MRCICEYNSDRDLVEVQPFGFVDIVKMNATSSLDVPAGVSEASYNNIEDPRSIADRPSDSFEAMQAEKSVSEYTAPKSE